jgi:release factor glutamine methyltransferase
MIAPRRPEDPPRAWTVADLLAWTEAHFRRLSSPSPSPRLDAEVLLAHALGGSRLELYTGYRKVVEPAERARFRSLVERRSKGEPVAYIVGAREFHSLRFEVGPAVLVPRPETEHLVDAAVEFLRARAAPPAPAVPAEAATPPPPPSVESEGGGEPAATELTADRPAEAPAAPPPEARTVRVLDLGTGSGNIAVAVAVEIPSVLAIASDSSREALAVAARNAAAHGVAGRIEFVEGDLFEPLRSGAPRPPFDAVLSNPPYIAPRERPSLPVDVREFEPDLALFDRRDGPDGDGLGFHRAIAREGPALLAPGGLLAVEVGAGQAPAVEDLFRAAGLTGVVSIADCGGILRVVVGRAAGDP